MGQPRAMPTPTGPVPGRSRAGPGLVPPEQLVGGVLGPNPAEGQELPSDLAHSPAAGELRLPGGQEVTLVIAPGIEQVGRLGLG